jgi:hypothetical protein
MTEIKLQVPELLLQTLKEKSKFQGVSLEALCISLLERASSSIDPSLYSSLGSGDIRLEIRKVFSSGLPQEEKARRIRLLESQITRRIK